MQGRRHGPEGKEIAELNHTLGLDPYTRTCKRKCVASLAPSRGLSQLQQEHKLARAPHLQCAVMSANFVGGVEIQREEANPALPWGVGSMYKINSEKMGTHLQNLPVMYCSAVGSWLQSHVSN